MPRLFTGYSLPPDVAQELYDWSERFLKPLSARIIPADNLHVTSSFFGEVDSCVKDWLIKVVRSLPPQTFAVKGRGLKAVGRGAIAVLLEKIWEEEELQRLREAATSDSSDSAVLEQVLCTNIEELIEIEPVSVPVERRIYLLGHVAQLCHPTSYRRHHGDYHVTLARCREGPPSLATIACPQLAFALSEFHLYESKLGAEGPHYSILSTARSE